MPDRPHIVGVDIGGTFTDAIVIQGDGSIVIGKSPSTPPNFEQGFIGALEAVANRMGSDIGSLLTGAGAIYHGCTVGTNALVENRTAKVGLLTTRGHRDTILAMQAGARFWGMAAEEIAHVALHSKPDPLVPKSLIGEIDERIAHDGNEVVALNEEQCRAVIQELLDQGVEAFAVSLLWSVVDPAHELRVERLIRELAPEAYVSVGHEVSPRAGEYERTVAAVINALIGPAMSDYLGKLTDELARGGYDDELYVMSCSGGVIDADFARVRPILTIGSGPVAGLIGAGALSRLEAEDAAAGDGSGEDVLTADMGGTTFDVGVIRQGEPLRRRTTRHGQYEYFVPTLDVRSIGAGGGSIVRYDEEFRTLRVGPQSAGADPGPAAYGKGTEATVTDADLVLGYLNGDYFLGGRITLDMEKAREALARAGEPLGFGPEETAAAAARIVDSQMADAIRLASIQQGYDPREHDMYAYGGAGPVHATAITRELGINRIVVPLGNLASGWSALGVVSSDVLLVDETPLVMPHPFDPARLNEAWEQLEEKIAAIIQRHGSQGSAVEWSRSADVRYTAQVNEVEVQVELGKVGEAEAVGLVTAFEDEYARLFGSATGYPDAGYLMTAVRATARVSLRDFDLRADGAGASERSSTPAPKFERGVIFYERGVERVQTPVYDGDVLAPGSVIDGPAVIEFIDTTIVVRDGERAALDGLGSISITSLPA